jgi:hypothetical protein
LAEKIEKNPDALGFNQLIEIVMYSSTDADVFAVIAAMKKYLGIREEDRRGRREIENKQEREERKK